jgi:hypothetical protein
MKTIYQMARWVCANILILFHQKCITKPSTEKTMEVEADSGRKANFMPCVCATDGKHVRILKP